ncbi:MAG: RibD family protein, partial [Ruminococcus sp.]
IPLESKLVQTAKTVPLVIMTCETNAERTAALEQHGATVCVLPPDETGRSAFSAILQKIGEMGLDSVLIEGGAAIHAAALQTGMVQQVQVYLAPKLFGGDGLSPVGTLGITDPMQAICFSAPTITTLGQDLRLDYFAT